MRNKHQHKSVQIDDPFIPHGDIEYLMKYAGLDTDSLAKWIKNNR